MTFDEMQQSMKELRDNQVVQGQLVHAVERNLDRLGGLVEANTQAIAKLADSQVLLHSAMKGLVVTVEGLSLTVDLFIRDMGGNQHHPAGA